MSNPNPPSTSMAPTIAGRCARWWWCASTAATPRYLRQFLADGCDPEHRALRARGLSPRWPTARCRRSPARTTCRSSPARRRRKHGISGNFYLDTATWQPVVMTGPELLRGDTIIARFAEAGAKVVTITAKDKLRKQLGKGLDVAPGPCVLLQRVRRASARWPRTAFENVLPWLGMEQPGMYSMELCAAGAGGWHQAAGANAGPSCCTCR